MTHAPPRRGFVGLLALLVTALAALPASAELAYQIGVGVGFDTNDNIYLDPEPRAEGDPAPEAATSMTYSPTLELFWEEGEDSLFIDYRGYYKDYIGDEGLDSSFLHDLSAELSWRRAAPVYVEVQERLSVEPQTLDRSALDLNNQLLRNRLTLRTGFFWDISPSSTVEAGYCGELQTFSGAPNADSTVYNSGELSYRKSWSPLLRTSAQAAFGVSDREQAADSTQLRLTLEAERRWSRHLLGFARVMWEREKDHAFQEVPAGQSRDILSGTVWLRNTVERGAGFSLGFDQRSQDLYSGDTVTTRSGWAGAHWGARLGSTVDARIWYSRRDYRHSPQQETEWGPLVDVRYLLSDWAALDGAASWRNLVIEEEGREDIEDDVLRLAGGLVLLLGSHLQLETGVGYLTVDSSDPSRSYSTTRAYALMTVFFRPLAPGRFPRSFASRFMEASTPTARGAGIYAVDETQAGGR